MADNLMYLMLLVVGGFLVYYYVLDENVRGGCKWCPSCGSKKANGQCPSCPSCLLTTGAAQDILATISKGCMHRLQGVVRENLANAAEVSEFMTTGSNRLVVITNIDPASFVNAVGTGAVNNLKAVAISSTTVDGFKKYMVMAIADGVLTPIGETTQQFVDAFEAMESTARKELGPDTGTLVFFIDEDIPCPVDASVTPIPELPIVDEGVTIIDGETGVIEECCGSKKRIPGRR